MSPVGFGIIVHGFPISGSPGNFSFLFPDCIAYTKDFGSLARGQAKGPWSFCQSLTYLVGLTAAPRIAGQVFHYNFCLAAILVSQR